MLDVCLLGTGGMMPLPGRFLTSLLMRYNGESVLIDCGEGTQVAIRKKGWSMNPIGLICVTHFHGDHISGLPGLLLSIGNSDRTDPVTIVGPKGLESVVRSLLVIAQDLPFELRFIEIDGKDFDYDYKGLHIKAFRVKHNVVCYGYRVTLSRSGKFHPELANENNVPLKYWNRLQKGETIEAPEGRFTPEMVLGPERKGLKLTYVTDTRPTQTITEMAKEADLFICEGMYGEADCEGKAKDKKHMTMQEAAHLARKAGVAEMWLTHYSPSVIDPKIYIKEVRKIFPETYICRDGRKKELDFTD